MAAAAGAGAAADQKVSPVAWMSATKKTMGMLWSAVTTNKRDLLETVGVSVAQSFVMHVLNNVATKRHLRHRIAGKGEGLGGDPRFADFLSDLWNTYRTEHNESLYTVFEANLNQIGVYNEKNANSPSGPERGWMTIVLQHIAKCLDALERFQNTIVEPNLIVSFVDFKADVEQCLEQHGADWIEFSRHLYPDMKLAKQVTPSAASAAAAPASAPPQ